MSFKDKLVSETDDVAVALDEVKEFLRMDDAQDDEQIVLLIKQTQSYLEKAYGRAILTKTYDHYVDGFCKAGTSENEEWWDGVRQGALQMFNKQFIELPREPFLAFTSFTIYAKDNTSSVWPAAGYFVDDAFRPARIWLSEGYTWPTNLRLINGSVLRYTIGYGATEATVPNDIKLAIKLLVNHWYENRELFLSELMSPTVKRSIEGLLKVNKVRRLWSR